MVGIAVEKEGEEFVQCKEKCAFFKIRSRVVFPSRTTARSVLNWDVSLP